MSNETTTDKVEELSDFEREFMAIADGGHDDVDQEPTPNDEQEIEQEETDLVEPTESQDSNDNEMAEPEEDSELEALKKERDHFKHGFDANKGRVSALQKKINDLESKLNEPVQKPVEEVVNPDSSGMTDEQWNEFREEFPELATAMEAKLNSIQNDFNARLNSEVSSRLSSIEEDVKPLKQKTHDEYVEGQLAMLTELHPDWREVASSENFNKWIEGQTRNIQELMNSLDADDAASVFDLYKLKTSQAQKVQTQAVNDNRKSRLQSNVGVKAKGAKSSASVPSDYDDAFNYFASQSN